MRVSISGLNRYERGTRLAEWWIACLPPCRRQVASGDSQVGMLKYWRMKT